MTDYTRVTDFIGGEQSHTFTSTPLDNSQSALLIVCVSAYREQRAAFWFSWQGVYLPFYGPSPVPSWTFSDSAGNEWRP